MTITATCGHRIPDTAPWRHIRRKGYTRQGKRAIIDEVVCKKCKRIYLLSGDILHTETDEQEWVNYDD